MNTPSFSAWQCADTIDDWREAIKLACQPLEQKHIISESYTNAIIQTTGQLGCWYILSPGFALPHARPQQGVTSSQSHLSLLRIINDCLFPDHEPVGLVIVLAAASNNQHITTIQRLTNWLDTDNRLARILISQHRQQLHAIIQENAS